MRIAELLALKVDDTLYGVRVSDYTDGMVWISTHRVHAAGPKQVHISPALGAHMVLPKVGNWVTKEHMFLTREEAVEAARVLVLAQIDRHAGAITQLITGLNDIMTEREEEK